MHDLNLPRTALATNACMICRDYIYLEALGQKKLQHLDQNTQSGQDSEWKKTHLVELILFT